MDDAILVLLATEDAQTEASLLHGRISLGLGLVGISLN